MKVYERTENGTTEIVGQREGLAEINHAMMAGKRDVRTMSSISRTDYAIEYRDGRSVRLVLVDAPTPEGYTQGQAVVVNRPGQAPVTGTVAHIHTAPGYVAVFDDKYRSVSDYPTRFVSAAEMAEGPVEEPEQGPKAWTGEATRIVTVKGKRYVVGTIVPARPRTPGATSWIPEAYVSYWSERNGATFGATRSASASNKPGTVGRAIWEAVTG
ncbi:hypothetical protein OG709_30145 [Streptomyces sp. NBC_01267]|uniref:hypothetical protein n=1 Tax=Streptomyces sp. NBC_01267 TaxID=2903805 RepID=UPI002E3633F8|nr:hypothetical protein [Streptomyces sp. NBC_01267]